MLPAGNTIMSFDPDNLTTEQMLWMLQMNNPIEAAFASLEDEPDAFREIEQMEDYQRLFGETPLLNAIDAYLFAIEIGQRYMDAQENPITAEFARNAPDLLDSDW